MSISDSEIQSQEANIVIFLWIRLWNWSVGWKKIVDLLGTPPPLHAPWSISKAIKVNFQKTSSKWIIIDPMWLQINRQVFSWNELDYWPLSPSQSKVRQGFSLSDGMLPQLGNPGKQMLPHHAQNIQYTGWKITHTVYYITTGIHLNCHCLNRN